MVHHTDIKWKRNVAEFAHCDRSASCPCWPDRSCRLEATFAGDGAPLACPRKRVIFVATMAESSAACTLAFVSRTRLALLIPRPVATPDSPACASVNRTIRLYFRSQTLAVTVTGGSTSSVRCTILSWVGLVIRVNGE